ncbi:unnamed protein product, partial [Eretmochelys imbricata]
MNRIDPSFLGTSTMGEVLGCFPSDPEWGTPDGKIGSCFHPVNSQEESDTQRLAQRVLQQTFSSFSISKLDLEGNYVYAIRPSRSLLISHVQGMKTSRKLPFCSPPQCASWFVGSHIDLVDYVPQLQHVCGLEKWMIQLADQICCVSFDALDPERLIQCPYDNYHRIRACWFPYHLIKCRKVPHSVTIEVLFVACLQMLCTYFCNVNTSSQVPGRSPSLPGAQWPGPSISKISGVYNEVVSLLAHMDDQDKGKIALRIAFIAETKLAIVLTVLLEKLQKDEQNRVDIYCVLEKVLQQDTQGLERRLLKKIITLASNHMTETQEARNELKVAASNTLVTLARCYFSDVMLELMHRLELREEFIFITLGNLSSAY